MHPKPQRTHALQWALLLGILASPAMGRSFSEKTESHEAADSKSADEEQRQNATDPQRQPGSAPQVSIEDIFAFVAEAKITTATRTERTLKSAPGAVSVITRQQIEQMGATTVADALRLLPGVSVRLSPMGSVLGMRSVGATPFAQRVLLLIDGVPYNSPDKGGFAGHPAFDDFFPLEHVLRIEVVKGPGSALYGQNAYSGIVNIITRSGNDLSGGELDLFFGQRDTAQFRLSQGYAKDQFEYSFSTKFKKQGGGMEFTRNAAFDTREFFFKTSYGGFEMRYLFHRDDLEEFTLGTQPNSPQSLPTEQSLNLFDLGYEKKIGDSWTASSKFLINRRSGSTCASCHDSEGRGTRLDSGRLAGAAFIEAHREVNQRYWLNFLLNYSSTNHNFIAGTELQSDRTKKDIVQRPDRDESVNNFAGFVQDEIFMMEGKLIATLGARIDENEYTDTSFSPSGSLVYLPNERFVVRGLAGRAFRQPTWNDLFLEQRFVTRTIPTIAGQPTEFRRAGNPELDTEKVETIQLGFEYFFSSSGSIKFDAFYSRIDDLIQNRSLRPVGFPPFIPTPPRPAIIGAGGPAFVSIASNRVDEIDVRGAEVEVRWRPNDRFSSIFGYAYQTDDLDPTEDVEAAYAPEHKLTGLINIRPNPKSGVNFNFNTWSSFNNTTPGLTLGLTPAQGINFGEEVGQSYVIAHLRLWYDLWQGEDDNKFGVSFQLRNLFDEQIQQSPANGVDTSLLGRLSFFKMYYHF